MPDKVREKIPNTPTPDNAAVFGRIGDILEEARSHVARTINSAMVVAYWLIGREIVEEEQKGQKRADYGKALLQDLSRRLNKRYGGGFSVTTLKDCRKFYLIYGHRLAIQHPLGAEFTMPAIGYPVGRELGKSGNPHPPGGELTPKQRPPGVESATGFHPDLSWSHYRALMRVENEEARQFYEQETARNHWNKRQLERQINTLLFERLLKSRDKDGVLQHANGGQATEHPIDIIKVSSSVRMAGSACGWNRGIGKAAEGEDGMLIRLHGNAATTTAKRAYIYRNRNRPTAELQRTPQPPRPKGARQPATPNPERSRPESARHLLDQLVSHFRPTAPALAQWLETNVPEGFAMFSQPGSHRQRTSNPIEAAVMKQIRRRTRAGGIFPNEASCLRLVAVALVEIDGQWQTSRLPYLSPENDAASENDRISIPNVT